MKKDSKLKQSSKQSPKRAGARREEPITIGMDLGDKTSRWCALGASGEVRREGTVGTTRKAMLQRFGGIKPCRIAMEVGTHSPWVSRWLTQLGHEVIVANARQVRLISHSSGKDDRMDAEKLARLARVDPALLRPIRHRGEETQLDLMAIRVRRELVESRTGLINAARGLAKAMGERLPSCDADSMRAELLEDLPAGLQARLKPLVEQVESLTRSIQEADKELEQIARIKYPETALLQQVKGVGVLIALTFMLTVEAPERFQKSRDVGCYVGLRPKRSQSGERQPELGITKEGDAYLRTLLVQGAHYILGWKGPDTDLRRWGQKLAGRGGKNAKKRAIVAVARKLGILLHRLWVTQEVYEPLRNSPAPAQQAA